MKRTFLAGLFVLAAALATPLFAAPGDPVDLSYRTTRLHVDYVVNPDGTSVETIERAVKVLNTKAVEYSKKGYFSYSTSVQKAEILEAYTMKADGRRIDAPRSNYQMDINKGRDADSPAFSDRTRFTVIFPDVAVEDVVVLKYRLTESEAMFPGHFSEVDRFSREEAYDDVKITIDAPASLWTQHAVTAFTETRNETKDGRKYLAWTWKNPNPVQGKRKDWTAYDPDKEPGFAISTFRTYAEIAEAYGKRARPKAVATDRVKKLADDIVKETKGQKEQARALYEWVATNINYAGNCVGVGAVVPRDQAFVLDNKMGDCKDHATLLQALLSAKGIESTQALVNAGSTYRLPKVPVISMVNHVIVYVPSLNLYLDSTSATTPFGMIPMGDADKPVLLVDGYKEGLRTPPIPAEANKIHARTDVEVKANGGVAGTVKVASNGMYAVSGRDRLRNVTAQEREMLFERMYKRNNKTGFGKLEGDDPKPLLPSFNYKVSFETEEFTQVPGPGAFTVNPLYYTEGSIAMLGGMTEDETEAEETACIGGTVVEEYAYRLPKGVKVLAVPKGVSVKSSIATYTSKYELKGNVLNVKRELVDKTDRNVCPVAVQREFAAFARKVAADLKTQVVYQ